MGAGIVFPYVVDYFPGVHLWQITIAAFLGMLFIGWLDYKLRLLHEEQNYMTQQNPVLMAGLRGKLKKENEKNCVQ